MIQAAEEASRDTT